MILDDKNNKQHDLDLKKAIETLESRMIFDCLQKTRWHRGKTAEMLKIPRRTLQRKMVKYGFRNLKKKLTNNMPGMQGG